ncbi:MAG: hypothetical protein RML95_01650 [Anaerolineae bacterium]|nr:hypothetical protein [Anaerolineae bacterium]
MGKPNKPNLAARLRQLLDELGRLLKPPKVAPARVPVRNRPVLPRQ